MYSITHVMLQVFLFPSVMALFLVHESMSVPVQHFLPFPCPSTGLLLCSKVFWAKIILCCRDSREPPRALVFLIILWAQALVMAMGSPHPPDSVIPGGTSQGVAVCPRTLCAHTCALTMSSAEPAVTCAPNTAVPVLLSHPERLRRERGSAGSLGFPLLLFPQQACVGVPSLMIFHSCICIFTPGIRH